MRRHGSRVCGYAGVRECGVLTIARRQAEGATVLALQTISPVAGLLPVVRYRQDSDVRCHLQVDDVIRKPRDGSAANCQVSWQSANQGTGARQCHDLLNRGIDGIEELDAQVAAPSLVPAAGQAVFGVCLVVETNARVHRSRSSASARRRTSSQGTPPDSSARARRARRSISAAHAASTSAGCSAAASSRLANSSAAMSARSSRGSAKASRRTCCARDVMPPFYTRGQPQHGPAPDATCVAAAPQPAQVSAKREADEGSMEMR
jgi:hypothetical protein